MFRRRETGPEVFLVHPGGPFWTKKDDGAWSIPKGEYSEGEDALEAARREFQEETGIAPEGDLIPLTDLKQASGKIVSAWALSISSPPPEESVELIWLNVFYAVEWVVFAGFAIVLWYRLVRDAVERERDAAAEAEADAEADARTSDTASR